MIFENKIVLAADFDKIVSLPCAAVPRHLLISGDSGTGKTATLQVLAESFSALGLPVFCSDVSGDLGGLCKAGSGTAALPDALKDTYRTRAYPVRFWSSGKEAGIPLRVRVSDMGPELLATMLSLTPAQTNLLATVFRIADETGLELCDFKDLRSMLKYVNDNRKEFAEQYGTVTPTTVNAVQRALLALENDGVADVFGEPALDPEDLLAFADDGRGILSVLNAAKLAKTPRIYQAVVLWILTFVCEQLAQENEDNTLSAVFCFDNADVLFEGISKDTADKIAQVLDILTEKGIGVCFASRNVTSVPAAVLSKIGNRIQHRKAVNTPEDKKDIKASAAVLALAGAAETERTISVLETGDAIFSLLGEDGFTRTTAIAHTLPGESKAGSVKAADAEAIVAADSMTEKYKEAVDRETAYEKIAEAEAALAKQEAKANGTGAAVLNAAKKTGKSAVTSAVSSVSNSVSTNIVNSITGGKKKSAKEIAAKAAKSALSSTMRNGINSILRGLFGTKKK